MLIKILGIKYRYDYHQLIGNAVYNFITVIQIIGTRILLAKFCVKKEYTLTHYFLHS